MDSCDWTNTVDRTVDRRRNPRGPAIQKASPRGAGAARALRRAPWCGARLVEILATQAGPTRLKHRPSQIRTEAGE